MADYASERQQEARRAYGDLEKSIEIHGKKMETFNVDIRKNGAMRNRALVLAGLAGLCTAAGAIGACTGAPQLFRSSLLQSRHSMKVLAWAILGGFGAAFVTTGAFTFERAIYDLELRRELWEIENHLTGELQEMISIYKCQGLSEEEAITVTRIFAKQKMLFANLMMVEELGYSRLEPPTLSETISSASVPIVAGYTLGLMLPLLPVLFGEASTGAAAASLSSNGASGGAASTAGSSTNSGGGDVIGTGKAAMEGFNGLARLLSTSVLLLGGAFVSFMETEVFFGAYAQRPVVATTIAVNTAGIAVIYALSYATARFS